MGSKRVKVIAGEIIMVAAELRSLDAEGRRRVLIEVGAKTYNDLIKIMAQPERRSGK